MSIDTISIMKDAFNVGKQTIIDWINEFLLLDITKIEQCATGAIHCQIFDALNPG